MSKCRRLFSSAFHVCTLNTVIALMIARKRSIQRTYAIVHIYARRVIRHVYGNRKQRFAPAVRKSIEKKNLRFQRTMVETNDKLLSMSGNIKVAKWKESNICEPKSANVNDMDKTATDRRISSYFSLWKKSIELDQQTKCGRNTIY